MQQSSTWRDRAANSLGFSPLQMQCTDSMVRLSYPGTDLSLVSPELPAMYLERITFQHIIGKEQNTRAVAV